MWVQRLPSALSMGGAGGGYARGAVCSILCKRAAQVAVRSSTQKARAMPPSWLRERWAASFCCSTQRAVSPVNRYTGAPLSSRSTSISHRENGSRRAGARRLEERFLGCKIRRRAGGKVRPAAARGQGVRAIGKAQRSLLAGAEYPAGKGPAVGAE